MITTIKNNAIDYSLVVSDKATGSLFRDVTSGVNTPREISIRHQDYTDSKTKKVGRRTVIRKDRYIEMADGTIAPVSFMLIAMIPRDANVTAAHISDVANACELNSGFSPDSTALGTAVFSNAEQ